VAILPTDRSLPKEVAAPLRRTTKLFPVDAAHPRSSTSSPDTTLAAASHPGKLRKAMQRMRTLNAWQRALVAVLALPPIIAGGAASAYYLNLHRIAGRLKISDLGCLPAPTQERRILVLSPHCDDETLGAGALIADARRAGVPVSVAFLTNGDGFRVAASRALGEVSVSPADFVRFAEQRQVESLAALHELGVDEQHVQFLGYPDRGLKPMWEKNWKPSTPFRSAFTNHTRSPYPRAFTPRTFYCGEYLVQDLVRLMETERPTDIYVTHPSDDHPDHLMAPAYAEAALRMCRERFGNASWAQTAQIHYYLIHRGDWPLPQGYHPKQPLLPPSGLTNLDTHWSVYTSSPEATAAKRRALEKYVSQTTIESRFLRSFLRTNELFGDIAACDVCPDPVRVPLLPSPAGVPVPTGGEATVPDPIGDDLLRYATPAADITGISVRHKPGANEQMQIEVRTRGGVSRRVHYSLQVRAISDTATPSTSGEPPTSASELDGSRFISLPLTPTAPAPGARGGILQAEIPLKTLGLDGSQHDRCIWISAETRLSSRLPEVDRTGYRPFPIQDASPTD